MAMNLRNQDKVGPDYKCSKCGLHGHRLWRQPHATTDFLCAVCAEESEVENIALYARHHAPTDTTIGNLLPCRPSPEGNEIWGHTCGDIEWWHALPQYVDPVRELELVRRERNHFCTQYVHYTQLWLEERMK